LPNGGVIDPNFLQSTDSQQPLLGVTDATTRQGIQGNQQQDAIQRQQNFQQQDKQTRNLLGDKDYMASVLDQMDKKRRDKIAQVDDPNSQYYRDIATQQSEDEKNAYHGPISLGDRVASGSNAVYRGLGTMGKGIVRAAGRLSKAITPDAIGSDGRFDYDVNKVNDAIDGVVKWAKDYHGLGDKKEAAINKGTINGMINGLAEYAPAIISSESIGGMSFFLNDYEKGYENIDKTDKEQGLNLTEGQKQAYATVNGTVSALIMTHNLSSLLGNTKEKATQSIIDNVSHDVIGNLAKSGEDFNAANLKKYTYLTLDGLENKVKNFGIQSIKRSASSAGDLGTLEALKIGTDKLTNTVTGKRVFDTSDQAERMHSAILGGAILGGAASILKAPMLLAKGGEERNSVTESLYNDPSPENSVNIKDALTQHLGEKGFTPEEIDHTHNIVDQIHQVVKSLPKGLPEEKQTKVVDLILQRKDLEKTLTDAKENTKQIDPAFVGGEDLVTQHRIDGINDQIKSIATDMPVKIF